MKKASLIILSALLLSACSLKNPAKTKSPDVTNPTLSSPEITELSQEATSTSDKDIIKAFESDKDSDFSTEFSSLEKDLQ